MDSESYRYVLARIERVTLAEELEAGIVRFSECSGQSPRRRSLLHAVQRRREERRIV